MSGMILCRSKMSKLPYIIKNTNIRIFSLEELCYYIYNNIYLISNDFISVNLLSYIRDEIQDKYLYENLLELKNKNAGLAEMLVMILKYVDYYTPQEIESIRGVLDTLNTQNVFERMKARADSFLNNQCYYSAIKNYMNIIDGQRDNTLPGIFYARVFHNVGTAYAKMYLFGQASSYYKEAYRIGQHEISQKCYFVCKMLDENFASKDDKDATEDEYVIRRELETIMDNAVYSDEYRNIENVEKMKNAGNMSDYYNGIDDILGQWKKEYKNFTS